MTVLAARKHDLSVVSKLHIKRIFIPGSAEVTSYSI